MIARMTKRVMIPAPTRKTGLVRSRNQAERHKLTPCSSLREPASAKESMRFFLVSP